MLRIHSLLLVQDRLHSINETLGKDWLERLSLQNSVTFGSKNEADESAHRINKLHEVIKGNDEVTGDVYDALDHEQLLWVHACLQISSIYFYEKTVKKLSVEEKNKYHEENMVAAGLVLIDIDEMPQTHEELKEWVVNKSKTEIEELAKNVDNVNNIIISEDEKNLNKNGSWYGRSIK